MIRRPTLCLLLLLAAPRAFADQYGGFQQYADSGSLKPFCRDLGGILGSATFHSGRILGLSGWDLGVRGGAQFYPEKNDRILRNHGVRAFGLPWVQAEIGMPFYLDGFIRGVSYQGLTIAGGGIRYGLLKSNDKKWAPQLLASLVGHSVVHQHFSASQFGGSLVGSMGTTVFTPFAGAGFDRTRLVVRSSLLDPTLNGSTVATLESRFTAGVQLRPTFGKGQNSSNFIYITLAYLMMHGQSGSEAGLGIRF